MPDTAALTRLDADQAFLQAAFGHFSTRISDDACEEYAQVVACLEKAHDWLRVRRERAGKEQSGGLNKALTLPGFGKAGAPQEKSSSKPAMDDISATSQSARLD